MWRVLAMIAFTACVVSGEDTKPPAPKAESSERIFEVEGPEEALRVSFDDLELRQLLDVQKVPVDVEDQLPEWLKKLNGKTVRTTGWMFPPPTETELPAFLLVKTAMWMDFGRRLHADEKIGVRMRKGVTADYISDRSFDVVGKFTIKSRVDQGELLWLYMIEDAVVIDLAKSTPLPAERKEE